MYPYIVTTVTNSVRCGNLPVFGGSTYPFDFLHDVISTHYSFSRYQQTLPDRFHRIPDSYYCVSESVTDSPTVSTDSIVISYTFYNDAAHVLRHKFNRNSFMECRLLLFQYQLKHITLL